MTIKYNNEIVSVKLCNKFKVRDIIYYNVWRVNDNVLLGIFSEQELSKIRIKYDE